MSSVSIIGITTYGVNSSGEIPLPEEYVSSVRRAGGIPVLIPPGDTSYTSLLDRLDGIVLAGGGDICPTRYGGESHETIYMVNESRDASELELVAEILRRRMPLLAICRGLQILNVALGGTLHEHLPDVVGEDIAHRAPPRKPTPHQIDVVGDSRLARIMATERTECMSWHHQAVDRLAEGCRVVARAPDGVVEAFEIEDHPEVIAVQWHPELSSERDPHQQNLFDALHALSCHPRVSSSSID